MFSSTTNPRWLERDTTDLKYDSAWGILFQHKKPDPLQGKKGSEVSRAEDDVISKA